MENGNTINCLCLSTLFQLSFALNQLFANWNNESLIVALPSCRHAKKWQKAKRGGKDECSLRTVPIVSTWPNGGDLRSTASAT